MFLTNRLKKLFFNYFYIETTLTTLALSRIVIFGYLFFLIYDSNYANYALPPKELWTAPGVFNLLSIPIYSFETIVLLQKTFKISIFFSILGFLTPISMKISVVLGFYLWGVHKGFVSSDFRHHLMLYSMSFLAFSKAGGAISLDRLLNIFNVREFVQISSQYGWPFRSIQFCFSMMYVSAGLSKIRNSGFNWIQQDYLLFFIEQSRINFHSNIPQLGHILFNFLKIFPSLFNTLALLTILIELSLIGLIFKPQYYLYYLPVLLFLHFGVYLLMGIYSSIWLIPIAIVLLPWDKWTINWTICKIVKPFNLDKK